VLNISKNTNTNLNDISNSERFSYLNKNIIKKQKLILTPKYKTMKEYNEIDINIFSNKDYDSEKQNTDKSSPNERIVKKINRMYYAYIFAFAVQEKGKILLILY